MKRRAVGILSLLLVLCLCLVGTTALAGRADKAGTSAASELLIPVGSRAIALGGSSAATISGIDAILWNPAGLDRTTLSAEATFSHMSYIGDLGVEYAAAATAFEGFGSVGVSLRALSFGDIEITTEDNPEGTGQFYSPTFVTVGLTYSRLLTDRIAVGITANVISERIDRVDATGIAFDFGVQYTSLAGIRGLAVGVAVRNIGPTLKYDGPGLYREATATDNLRPPTFYKIETASDEIPSVIELGLAYQVAPAEGHALNFTGAFENNNFSDDQYKFGGEYVYNDLLAVRAGYAFGPETLPGSQIFGFTAGAGVHYAFSGLDFTFDYAYRAVEYFDANHSFTVKLGF